MGGLNCPRLRPAHPAARGVSREERRSELGSSARGWGEGLDTKPFVEIEESDNYPARFQDFGAVGKYVSQMGRGKSRKCFREKKGGPRGRVPWRVRAGTPGDEAAPRTGLRCGQGKEAGRSPRNSMRQDSGSPPRRRVCSFCAVEPPPRPGRTALGLLVSPRVTRRATARAGVGGRPAGDTGLRCPDPAPRNPGVRPLPLRMQAPSPPRPASSPPSSSRPPPRTPTSPPLSSALKSLLTQHFEQILEVFGPDNLPVAREVGHGGDAGGPLRSFCWSTGR